MSSEIEMQIMMYCEAINTGTKSVAMMNIQTRYTPKLKQITEKENLHVYIKNVASDQNWKIAYIYKYSYLIDVIKIAPEYPSSIYDHWVLGKLFGYSDEAIELFVTKLFDN